MKAIHGGKAKNDKIDAATSSGPDPVSLFGAAWTFALRVKDAPGDDPNPNHPGSIEVS
jgi:hypothetical protein